MGQFPQDGENGQNVAFFSSAVTKRFDFFNFSQLFWRYFRFWKCFVLVLPLLEPELELFEVWQIMVLQIIIIIISDVINFKQLKLRF